jgi:two-component system response regulator YesN
MYSVLIADDEPLMLEGLKSIIDWKSLGFTVCATVTSV